MSLGGIIGGIVGGIIGYFIPGLGILYGASIGFTFGLILDPIIPDTTPAGTPLPDELDLMPANVGVPLPDLVGTSKILGHLLCFGKERAEAITVEIEGGCMGSDETYITGYKYYMSWAVGIVAGPIDMLYAIYKNDDVVWEGELTIPGAGGQETIVLEGMGSAIFYFGSDDQVANDDVGDIIGDDTLNSPYRNFCWCFFDDCYIGEFNRCPTMKFIVRKSPVIAFSGLNVIEVYNYNPIHAMWYTLHDLAGLPETWLHTADFAAAASTLSSESRGICCLFDNQQSALNYLENFNNHIDGIIRYGSDGKFHPKLIRDDYVVDDLPLIDESVMLEKPTFNRKSWIDTINEIKVQYSELISNYPFAQGRWVAPMSYGSYIYVYDSVYKAVIKLYTGVLPPICYNSLVITEYSLDYDQGYGVPGTQRGGYCMNPDGTRLWYLVRDGLNCNLIEVDITSYYMEIIGTTIFSSLLASGELINDAVSDDTYTYWCTNLVGGRVIKIRNSDHVIIDDHYFNYPVEACSAGAFDQGIVSIGFNASSGKLYWVYCRDHSYCSPAYMACRHLVKSAADLTEELDDTYCATGVPSPAWQNFIRIYDGYLLHHQAYHPSWGFFYVRDLVTLASGGNISQEYLLNILGVESNLLFTLMHNNVGAHTTHLYCINFPAMTENYKIAVSDYTGHPISGEYSATSAMSNYYAGKTLSLFRYDATENVNIITNFSADELLTKLAEGAILSKEPIDYGA